MCVCVCVWGSDGKLKESKTAFIARYDCCLSDHFEVTRVVPCCCRNRFLEGCGTLSLAVGISETCGSTVEEMGKKITYFGETEFQICRPQRPRGVRRRSAAARLLRSWVRIPPEAWIFVCCECRVLSGRGLCDELITRPEESYRMWCVVVCDLETLRKRRP